MSECISNLLIGTGKRLTSYKYYAAEYATTEPLVVGNTYTISVYVEDVECDGATPRLAIYDGGSWANLGDLKSEPGTQTLTFTYQQPYPDHCDPNRICIYNTPPMTDKKRKTVFRHVMLVNGATPAAWAPAKNESLAADAGGGRRYD